MAPRNAYPAYLLAKNDRIGRERLDLVNQSHVNPLGLHALCSLRSALCPLPSSPSASSPASRDAPQVYPVKFTSVTAQPARHRLRLQARRAGVFHWGVALLMPYAA
jgi:hypothetical protein